ncbi:LysR family transcriptional regulator [Inquilinus sp. OTU3971]|uniref:LysR family transcriptional regulator n=1 Tax=Inquilinus sp. OTU3971 TaxID=3043855 RepID=UPI00313E12D6
MDLHRVDLNLLVSLDALLTERNVTRAARRLGKSQSAMSTQLRHLRRIFGDPLLIPQARGVLPTDRALELAGPLKQLLADLEAFMAERAGFDPATTAMTLRVAAADAIQAVLGVPLLRRLRRSAPGLRLALKRVAVDTFDHELETGRLDLLFVTRADLLPHWRARPVYREQFVCAMRQGHPAASGQLDLAAFCEAEHVLVSTSGGGFTGVVDEALADLGRVRRVAVSVHDFLIVPRILAETDLIATLPARIGRSFAAHGLLILQPPLALPGFDVHMAWHARTHNDPAHRWFRDQALQVAHQL